MLKAINVGDYVVIDVNIPSIKKTDKGFIFQNKFYGKVSSVNFETISIATYKYVFNLSNLNKYVASVRKLNLLEILLYQRRFECESK